MRAFLISIFLSAGLVLASVQSRSQVVGQYTGMDHASNYTNPQQGSSCDNIQAINEALGDADFENGTAEIPLGWQFSGTWASGSTYLDGPGPELLLVSLHSLEEAWHVALILDNNTTTPFQSYDLNIETSNAIGSLTHCGGIVFDFEYERPSQELDFADYAIPNDVGVIGVVFEPYADGAVLPDPHGVMVLEGTLSCDTSITTMANICEGDSVFFEGDNYGSAGVFSVIHTNAAGCDSTLILDLTVNPLEKSSVNISICDGDSVFLEGDFQLEAGIYVSELQTIDGCDSTAITDLTIDPTYLFSFEEEICLGDSLEIGGEFYQIPGSYARGFETNKGCDSTKTVQLSVIEPSDATIQAIGPVCADNPVFNMHAATTGGSWSGIGIIDSENGTFSPSEAGEGMHYLYYSLLNFCPSFDTISVTVEPECMLTIPTSFTPNGDQLNDFLEFENLHNYPNNRLAIYDRWGRNVFLAMGYTNDWDGGNLSSATYFFVLELNDSRNRVHTGSITLIR